MLGTWYHVLTEAPIQPIISDLYAAHVIYLWVLKIWKHLRRGATLAKLDTRPICGVAMYHVFTEVSPHKDGSNGARTEDPAVPTVASNAE